MLELVLEESYVSCLILTVIGSLSLLISANPCTIHEILKISFGLVSKGTIFILFLTHGSPLQDYGINFDDDNHLVKTFRCRCGSKFCQDMKRQTG